MLQTQLKQLEKSDWELGPMTGMTIHTIKMVSIQSLRS